MQPLCLTLAIKPIAKIDLSALTPDNLANKTTTSIKAIKLPYGSRKISVGEAFKVTGDDCQTIRIKRSCQKLQYIGKKMSCGQISVSPDAGDYAGQSMSGGCIKIRRNAGDWVGNQMSGGQIDIGRDVGDFLGGAKPGDKYGMMEGIIYVKGRSGNRTGNKMRRGLIFIAGDTGSFCANRMYAGTIIVLGQVGQYPGFGMRRGSLILAKQPRHITMTFRSNGALKIHFLDLLFKKLIKRRGQIFSILSKYRCDTVRLSGDLAQNGQGEILILKKGKSP